MSGEELVQYVEAWLEKAPSVKIPVSGGSMLPFIMPTDMVVLQKKSTYEVDDIVLATSDHGVVLHAVVREDFLMGTANLQQRERAQKIVGCVTQVIREEKVIDINRKWKFKMQIWRKLLPIRRILIRIWR